MLDYYAGVSSEDYPVYAISIARHPNLLRAQLKAEAVARVNYLNFARSKGYWIKHEGIEFSGSFDAKGPKGEGPPGQMWIWLTAISQCVADDDVAMFAYIKPDAMWHYKHEFVGAFEAIMALKGVEATVKFPFEWKAKKDILGDLKKAKVPDYCWWSCERPRGDGSRCGRCHKCVEIREARNG